MALARRGSAISLPLGVKQNTWSWNSSSLVCSRNSSGFEPSARSSMVRRSQAQALAHHRIGLRIELVERQVLELLAHLVHAHAPGERGVDVERLLGGATARL